MSKKNGIVDISVGEEAPPAFVRQLDDFLYGKTDIVQLLAEMEPIAYPEGFERQDNDKS